jgi:hypothetical protein
MEKLTSQELLILSILLIRLREYPTIGGMVTLTETEIEALSAKIATAVEDGRL